MKEELYYIDINNKSHFVHEHIPDNIRSIPFIFLNPILDEKKRSQKFFADTAREFCKHGIPVIRFDYYGTGDSEGQLNEMNISFNLHTIKIMIDRFQKKYQTHKINLFGLRLGADLAIEVITQFSNYVEQLIIIEPIINGKRYLMEQRSRRKIFHRLNNMTDISDTIRINGRIFEDYQGYPISENSLDYISNMDSSKTQLTGANILMIKLNTISSRKSFLQLKEKLEVSNNVQFIHFTCDDFWANLEAVDTSKLSKEIVNQVFCCRFSVSS